MSIRRVRYFVINGVFLLSIYYGLFLGHQGAENLAYFLAWFSIVFSFLLLSDAAVRGMARESRSVPQWLNTSLDLTVVACFAWDGAWVTAAFYLLHLFLTEGARTKSDGLRAAGNV